MEALLEVEALRVEYPGRPEPVVAVDDLSFCIQRGTTYALVGESGCGKSATGLAVLRLLEPGRIAAGRIRLDGVELNELGEREMRRIRGRRIGIVFQEPGAALDPMMRVGAQLVEALRAHGELGRREAWAEAERLLARVALPDPSRLVRNYPHELSGGMQQRVMIAIALCCKPELLIADEPTTALDVTTQAQIVGLIRELKAELGLTVLWITHDMGIVAENADRVGVMYAGRLVEEAPVSRLFGDPLHPYTKGLLRSIPRGPGAGRELQTLEGGVPDPSHPPPGCRFHPRCPDRFERCDLDSPQLAPKGAGRSVACHLHREDGP
jgi:peptide/nickel transport system ATP-binding protein